MPKIIDTPLTDAQKLKLAIKAIQIAIKRLEEIAYQKRSLEHIQFLKDVLQTIESETKEGLL